MRRAADYKLIISASGDTYFFGQHVCRLAGDRMVIYFFRLQFMKYDPSEQVKLSLPLIGKHDSIGESDSH